MCRVVLVLLTFFVQIFAVRHPTVLQKIRSDSDLSQFSTLLDNSVNAKNSLYYSKVTVFAPTNHAFRKFNGRITHNLTSYHVVYSTYEISELADGNLEAIDDFPPLWVKRVNNSIYVNNAMVVGERSFVGKNMPDRYGKDQVLHVVDEVLDPVIDRSANPTAYDFLSRTNLWTESHTFKEYFSKVIQHHSEIFFKNEGEFTFFMPVDLGIDESRSNSIDSHVIRGHIIKNKVLFLRPSLNDYNYSSLADNDYINIVVTIHKEFSKYFVKSNTILGDSNHQTGQIKADILMPNIPLRNGVVHVISRPLAVFDQALTKFPLVEVTEKFSMDPFLNISYFLGSRSGFNHYLKGPKKFTFFVPRDAAWRKLSARINTDVLMEPTYLDLVKTILTRHLIVSDVPYFMSTMVDASKDGCMHLTTPLGKTCLAVYKKLGKYFVNWNDLYIEVYRPDYECVNGIVHVLDRPFLDNDDISDIPKDSISNFQLWGAILNLLFNENNT